jgi:hypothetical protein
MAESKVKVGMVYSARVGGTYIPVRIDKSLGHGRYQGVSLPGNAKVSVTTSVIKGAGQTPEEWQQRNAPREETPAPAPTDAAPASDVGARAKKSARPAKERKPGGLDCAVRVLREAGTPLNTGDMVKTMLEKGYWQTEGKTPAATIYAAIITEISKKGANSRFRKVARGQFELTEVGKAGN